MQILTALAAHNEWANARLFAGCSPISSSKLNDSSLAYDSVIGIFNHLIQVENSFFELAHGRQPQWSRLEQLTDLKTLCARIDRAYIEYASSLNPTEAESKRFLVPWFGFQISLLEGVVQPLTHSHKHRADISMLLPRLGGNGLEMDFIQWLDEKRG